jgi:hypothetical protein
MRAKRSRPRLPRLVARVLPFRRSSGTPKIYPYVWFFAEKI